MFVSFLLYYIEWTIKSILLIENYQTMCICMNMRETFYLDMEYWSDNTTINKNSIEEIIKREKNAKFYWSYEMIWFFSIICEGSKVPEGLFLSQTSIEFGEIYCFCNDSSVECDVKRYQNIRMFGWKCSWTETEWETNCYYLSSFEMDE